MIRLLIRGYQLLISPVLTLILGPGCGCRFQPTCSHYVIEAVETHGALRGLWLGLKRLGRCHPWGGSGFDPVPPAPCQTGAADGPASGGCQERRVQLPRHDAEVLCPSYRKGIVRANLQIGGSRITFS